MKTLLLIAVVLTSGISLIQPIVASAHGTKMHEHMSASDIQMEKLHAMMPIFSMASAELESALEKGDAAAAKIQANRILAAVPDLKKSRPHKNSKQLKSFIGFATKLQETVTATVNLANKGDIAGAKAAFKKVEETCGACHARFRD